MVTGDWHRKRAMGDLKRTEKRRHEHGAAQREAQERKFDGRPSVTFRQTATTPEAWSEEQQRVKRFLDAIGDAPKPAAPPSAQADAPAASVVPRPRRHNRKNSVSGARVSFEYATATSQSPRTPN